MSKELYESAALSQAAYAFDLSAGRTDAQRIAFVNSDINFEGSQFDTLSLSGSL